MGRLQEGAPATGPTVGGIGVLIEGLVVEVGFEVVEGNQPPVMQLDTAVQLHHQQHTPAPLAGVT